LAQIPPPPKWTAVFYAQIKNANPIMATGYTEKITGIEELIERLKTVRENAHTSTRHRGERSARGGSSSAARLQKA
jgi:hypothetical protein